MSFCRVPLFPAVSLAYFLCIWLAGDPFVAKVKAASPPTTARSDAYGDPLPPGALLRLGTVRWRACARFVAFTPDGATLVTVELDSDHGIRFWDAATGKETGSYRPASHALAFALAPDGKSLALDLGGQANGIVIISIPDGKELRHIDHDSALLKHLCFSPDGKSLAGFGYEGVVRVWDAADGKEILREQEAGNSRSAYLAFSPDGKTLAVARSPNTLRLLDAASGKELFRREPGHNGGDDATRVGFSPDGKKLFWAGEDPHSFALRDATTGKPLLSFRAPAGSVQPLAFSPDGKYIASMDFSGEDPPSLGLWDAATGKELRRLATSAGFYWPNNPMFSAAPAFSPDSRRLAWSGDLDGLLHVWDVETGKDLARTGEHQGVLCSVAFSPDGRTALTGCTDKFVRMWGAQKGVLRRAVEVGGRSGYEYAIAFSGDGKAAAVKGHHQSTEVWDLTSGKPRVQLGDGAESRIEPLFTPDGKRVATRGGGFHLWDAMTGENVNYIGNGEGGGGRSDFAPDGKTLVALRSQLQKTGEMPTTLTFWDAATGKELRAWPTHRSLHLARWSPDGRMVATTMGDGILMWDATAAVQPRPYSLVKGASQGSFLFCLAFSRDGKTIAAGSAKGGIYLWEVATAKVCAVLQGHQGRVTSLDFSPDGSRLISGSHDATALIWDLTGVADEKDAKTLTPERLSSLWNELADEDAGKARRAGWRLTADPMASLPFLQRHVHAAEVDAGRAAQLLTALDADAFEDREAASRELAKLGDLAESAMRKTLEGKPSLEARRRLEELLDKLNGPVTAPEQMRGLRCVEVLEHIGRPEAIRLLDELGKGSPGTTLTRDAKAALERLDRRKEAMP